MFLNSHSETALLTALLPSYHYGRPSITTLQRNAIGRKCNRQKKT